MNQFKKQKKFNDQEKIEAYTKNSHKIRVNTVNFTQVLHETKHKCIYYQVKFVIAVLK